jgi:hypothetical protein
VLLVSNKNLQQQQQKTQKQKQTTNKQTQTPTISIKVKNRDLGSFMFQAPGGLNLTTKIKHITNTIDKGPSQENTAVFHHPKLEVASTPCHKITLLCAACNLPLLDLDALC